jgi:hypothetical protein
MNTSRQYKGSSKSQFSGNGQQTQQGRWEQKAVGQKEQKQWPEEPPLLGLADSSQSLFPELFTTVVQQSMWESEEEEDAAVLDLNYDDEATDIENRDNGLREIQHEDQHGDFETSYAQDVSLQDNKEHHSTLEADGSSVVTDASTPALKRFPRLKRFLKRSDQRYGHLVNLETSVADSEDFPRRW